MYSLFNNNFDWFMVLEVNDLQFRIDLKEEIKSKSVCILWGTKQSLALPASLRYHLERNVPFEHFMVFNYKMLHHIRVATIIRGFLQKHYNDFLTKLSHCFLCIKLKI